jgi:hypothetical protein
MPRLAAAPPLVYQVRRVIQLNNAPGRSIGKGPNLPRAERHC